MIGKDINNAKADLLKDIKLICEEIQKVSTFSGLVSLESRIDDMYQDFIILKYLDQQTILSDADFNVIEEQEIQKEESVEVKKEPVTNNLPKLALSLNDKIAFQNQLFNKDSMLFNNVISEINKQTSLEETQSFVAQYAEKFEWELKEEFANRFQEMIEKRFL